MVLQGCGVSNAAGTFGADRIVAGVSGGEYEMLLARVAGRTSSPGELIDAAIDAFTANRILLLNIHAGYAAPTGTGFNDRRLLAGH